jgi:hypothetical protein
MIKHLFAVIALTTLLFSFHSCKKDNTKQNPPAKVCDSCYCQAKIDTLMKFAAETDSATIISKLKGSWNLQCVSFTSKYGYNTVAKRDSLQEILSVQFTDTTYRLFKDDSLLFDYAYLVDGNGAINSKGNSFYFGILGASTPRFNDSVMGLNSTYPFTGSYYLTFKKR